jgi:hypothetical protein
MGIRRQLPPPAASDAVFNIPGPQKKGTEAVEDFTSSDNASITERVLTAEDDSLAERESSVNSAARHQPEKYKESDKEEGSESTVAPSLPKHATYAKYSLEYNAARDAHLAARRNDTSSSEKAGWLQKASIDSHCDMISGTYGMTAAVPCGHCVAAGAVCRVYHQDCYKWDRSRSTSIKQDLGWRCERCRRTNNRTIPGGCDARFEK